MSTQTVQVFVRSSDVGAANPVVVATYPESRQVSNDTHGQGMSVYILPTEAIKQPSAGSPPTLVDNWQSLPGVMLMATTKEAARRVEETFPTSEQIASLHQTNEDLMRYGTDLSKWPLDARQRKADSDEKWKYVNEVNERVRAHTASPPHDLSSDKAWPTRPPSK
jgi:hypothetical protein